MRRLIFLIAVVVFVVPVFAATNAIPTVNQPLFPSSVKPGSAAFTLTVDGSAFVPGAVVNWNGVPLATKFVNRSRLRAAVPAADVAVAETATVTVTNPAPGGGTSFPVFFTVTTPSTSLTFVSSGLTVGTSVAAVAVGDFNGDGKIDLAVVNQGPEYTCNGAGESSYVSILLGKGDGTFTDGGSLELGCIAIGADGLAVKVADFNKDGRQDLAVSFFGEGGYSVAIYLGNGDGTFANQPSDVLPGWDLLESPVIVGDFNGDGNPDLAYIVEDELDFIAIYPGNGDGTFSGPILINENTNNSFLGGGWLVSGDFNGDGILDLAVPYIPGPVIILLGNGDGTFTPASSQPVTTLGDPFSSVSGDFNGDGTLDLAFADRGSTALTILLGNGDGTFTQKSGEPDAGQTTSFITTADFNGDGKLDLALVDSSNTILIFLGNGDGTFQTPLETGDSGGFFQLAIGDFTGSGRLDLAGAVPYSGQDVSLLLQSPAASLSPSSLKFGKIAVGKSSPPKRISLTNNGSAALHLSSFIASGDFAQTNNCGEVLALGQSCSIQVIFRPTEFGLRTGNITITDNASGSPQVIQLSGIGFPGLD